MNSLSFFIVRRQVKSIPASAQCSRQRMFVDGSIAQAAIEVMVSVADLIA